MATDSACSDLLGNGAAYGMDDYTGVRRIRWPYMRRVIRVDREVSRYGFYDLLTNDSNYHSKRKKTKENGHMHTERKNSKGEDFRILFSSNGLRSIGFLEILLS